MPKDSDGRAVARDFFSLWRTLYRAKALIASAFFLFLFHHGDSAQEKLVDRAKTRPVLKWPTRMNSKADKEKGQWFEAEDVLNKQKETLHCAFSTGSSLLISPVFQRSCVDA